MDVLDIKTESGETDLVIEIKTEPVEKEMSSNENELCEPCKDENVVAKADGKCKECGDFMCTTCFRCHLKAKLCRHHELIDATLQPIKTGKGNTEKCKHHGGEAIKFYCKRHETVGCGDCMVLKHNACNPEYITDLSKNYQENETFKCLLAKFEKLTSAIKEREKDFEDDATNNEMWHEKALEEVRKFRKVIDNYLDIAETRLLNEVNQLRSNNCKQLLKLEQDCKDMTSKIEKLKQKLDTELFQGNALFINTVKCKLYMPSIEKAVTYLQAQENIKAFEFVPDKQLTGIITSTKKLGHFDISKGTLSVYGHHIPTSQPGDITRQEDNMECINEDRQSRKRKKQEADAGNTSVGARVRPGQAGVGNTRVGARVRPGPRFTYDWDHCNKTGTVTSLEPDGTVTVKWDATGKSWSGYRIGAVWNGVQLI